jgi:hypothetical protein
MQAVAPRRHERAAAGAILLLFLFAAFWILRQHPPAIPVRIVESQTTATEEAPTPAAAQPPRVIELIELPDLSTPRPAPEAELPQPQQVQPPPVAVAMEQPRTEPTPAPAPPPPQVVRPPPPIVPLRPDPASPAPAKPEAKIIAPLRPETLPAGIVVPLAPDVPPQPQTEIAKIEITPVVPLRPGDEKPAAKPVPAVQPLRPEEPKVAREQEPPRLPEIVPKPEPVKRAPAIEKPKPSPPAPQAIAPPPPPAPSKPINEKEIAIEGRVLLRMFEQGSGPSIEIRWPAQASQRDRLYAVFTRCLGMQVGILDEQGHLYLGEGPRDQPLTLNTDKYSGFVRRPEGAIAADEQDEIAHIRQYHQAAAGAPPARMFPRRVDAFLLGGLRQAVGDQYLKVKSIRAAYRLNGNRVIIDSIVADGHKVEGAIDLSTVAASCSE